MIYYAISYDNVPATVVDQETYEQILVRHPETKVLISGTEKACNRYIEEFCEETEQIDLSDYESD